MLLLQFKLISSAQAYRDTLALSNVQKREASRAAHSSRSLHISSRLEIPQQQQQEQQRQLGYRIYNSRMSLPLGLTPRKRAKLDTFTSSFEELVAQLSTINGSLSSEAPSSQASRLAELSSLSLKREAFEDSLRRVKKQLEGVEQARDWREELDRAGVELWNRSTVFKDNLEAATAATEHVKSKVVVAQSELDSFVPRRSHPSLAVV